MYDGLPIDTAGWHWGIGRTDDEQKYLDFKGLASGATGDGFGSPVRAIVSGLNRKGESPFREVRV
jgi:hypothetical protein